MNIVQCNCCHWRGFGKDLIAVEENNEIISVCPVCNSREIEVIGYLANGAEETAQNS